MTVEEFRQIVLSMPSVVESSHMGHPDFRVRDKIFATVGYPDAGWGMVKLTPEQQAMIMASKPGLFKPASGAWGRRGSTLVSLETVDRPAATNAIRMAWENIVSG